MVPIDEYACNAIASAGRLSQISPPVNGEKSTTCQQRAPIEKASSPPPVKGTLESTPSLSSTIPMHLTCTEVEGATGSSVLLNCTAAA